MRWDPRTPRRAAALTLTAGLAVTSVACLPTGQQALPAATAPAPSSSIAPWPVMGRPALSAPQLAAWYRSKRIVGSTPTVGIDELARLYIEEGVRAGVAGDIAFVQAMIETGWLRFSTRVPGSYNNFAGIGAYDGGTGAAQFATAQLGVRAHVQLLRAYADPYVTEATLGAPPVTTTWKSIANWVDGKAPLWSDFGNGTWATSPDYAPLIDKLYRDAAAHAGVTVK